MSNLSKDVNITKNVKISVRNVFFEKSLDEKKIVYVYEVLVDGINVSGKTNTIEIEFPYMQELITTIRNTQQNILDNYNI